MSKSTHIVRLLYRRALHLYPGAFREAFADEMMVVFTRALDEAAERGGGALSRFCLREAGALSSSVVREQIAAYRARRLVPVQEGIFVQSSARVSYPFYMATILILFVAFCLLIVLPFFGHVLPHQFVAVGAGGADDPQGHIISQTEVGGEMRLLAMIAVVATPPGAVAFGLRLAYLALRDWQRLTTVRRRLVLIAFAMIVGVLVFLLSDVGRLMLSWYLD